jgi:hypothetical protein
MALYPTFPDAKGISKAFKEQVDPIPQGLSLGSPADTANIKEVILIYSSYTHEYEPYLPRIDRETQQCILDLKAGLVPSLPPGR